LQTSKRLIDTFAFIGRDGINPAHIFVRNENILKIKSLNQGKNIEILTWQW